MKSALVLFLSLLVFLPTEQIGASANNRQQNTIPDVRVQVRLDMKNGTLHGVTSARIPPFRRLDFSLRGMEVLSVRLGGHDISGAVAGGHLVVGPINSARDMEIEFCRNAGRGRASMRDGNFMGPDLAVLINDWMPLLAEPAIYHVEAEVPDNMVAVSEADRIESGRNGRSRLYRFEFPWPRTQVTLVAGRFVQKTSMHRGIEIATYFFREDAGLADGYIAKIRHYIDLYKDVLPPYPFRRFAVVENVMPTGYGMATYTLLGRQVARLPFIVDTSLGHEFVHSWFGNSVYVDTRLGDWCEGLTTFLADAFYLEQNGKGLDYRHRAMTEYQAWVHGDRRISLRQFRGQQDRASRAVGYGKAAMVFHMLKQEVGADTFQRAISRLASEFRFRQASWRDIQDLFEQESKRKLDWFFSQWLSRTDVPSLEFSRASVKSLEDGTYRAEFRITQKSSEPYRLVVPVRIITRDGDSTRHISIAGVSTRAILNSPQKIYGIEADPDLDVMRRLSPPEYPPVIARVLGAELKYFSVSDQERPVYRQFINYLVSRGFTERKPGGHRHSEYSRGAFVILGKADGGLKMLAGDAAVPEKGVEIKVRQGPFGKDSVICTIMASSARELKGIPAKFSHYGMYSTLLFEGGRLKNSSTAPYNNGVRLELKKEVMAVAATSLMPVRKIVRYISGDRIIYVSEKHDEPGHHAAQKKIIELLHKRGVKLAVGMEMFQRPSQKALDRYLAGKIDERAFLKQAEYFRRWGFDYHLYRPIVEYCRQNSIPVIALNLPKEISSVIARKGIEGLSAKERSTLPEDIDMDNRLYRRHLRDIFSQHSQTEMDNFEYFFQAQVAWDETMADTAASYLMNHPGRSLVVLAGMGHIAYGYGIPSRVARRIPGIESSIIINDPGDDMVPEAGDFFLFPPAGQAEKAPKLGVVIDDSNGTIVIKRVMPGSPAEKGGVKAGDIIEALDGHDVRDINDLRLELFFKQMGTAARLRLLRDGKTVELETGPLNSGTFNFGTGHGSSSVNRKTMPASTKGTAGHP